MGELRKKRARKSADQVENQRTKRKRCDSHENDETEKAIGVDKATVETSPLLRLPGELLNQIYGYLTVDRRIFFYSIGGVGVRGTNNQAGIVLPHECRSVSQSSRQLRDEVRSYVLHSGEFWTRYRTLDTVYPLYTRNLAELTFMKSLEIDITGTFCEMHKDKAAELAHSFRQFINKGNLRRVVVKGAYMEPFQGWPPMDPERLVYCLKRCLHLHTRRTVEVEANAQGWPSPGERGEEFRLYDIKFEEILYEAEERDGLERCYTEDEESIEEGDEWQTESEDGR